MEQNSLQSTGPIIASSESLTHAMIYEYAKDVTAVMHVHQFELWNHLLGSLPATAPGIEYGTPEMANDDKSIVQKVIGIAFFKPPILYKSCS